MKLSGEFSDEFDAHQGANWKRNCSIFMQIAVGPWPENLRFNSWPIPRLKFAARRAKLLFPMKALSWRALFSLRQTDDAETAPARPFLRRINTNPRVGLRVFDWNADAQTVGEWQRETYALNFPDFGYTPEFAAAFRHDLRRAALDENNGLFVLSELSSENYAGNLCGFVWVVLCHNNWTSERYGYINNLYIVPSRRGHGLSDELMSYAESWFRERGVSKLRLTVTSTNENACRLYERLGYQTQRFEMEKDI